MIHETWPVSKCFEKRPSVTVSAIRFERFRIFGGGLNVLESTHFEIEFEHRFCFFSKEIERVVVIIPSPSKL